MPRHRHSPVRASRKRGALMTAGNGLMAGSRGMIMGVASDGSIAGGIARAVAAEGAELAFTYPNDSMAKRVKPLAEQLGSSIVLECDVASDASIDAAFSGIAERWDRLDFLVHAIAFSDREELKGKYLDTSRRNFALTLDISCFSFTAVCQRAPLMISARVS